MCILFHRCAFFYSTYIRLQKCLGEFFCAILNTKNSPINSLIIFTNFFTFSPLPLPPLSPSFFYFLRRFCTAFWLGQPLTRFAAHSAWWAKLPRPWRLHPSLLPRVLPPQAAKGSVKLLLKYRVLGSLMKTSGGRLLPRVGCCHLIFVLDLIVWNWTKSCFCS